MKDGYEHMLGYQSFSTKRCSVALLLVVSLCATAVGLLTGLLVDAKAASGQHVRATNALQVFSKPQQPAHLHTVLSNKVWSSEAGWGRNCTDPAASLGQGLDLLCRLPSVWKDCSGGIYLDVVSAIALEGHLTAASSSCHYHHTNTTAVVAAAAAASTSCRCLGTAAQRKCTAYSSMCQHGHGVLAESSS
jgi:hypothetical protein